MLEALFPLLQAETDSVDTGQVAEELFELGRAIPRVGAAAYLSGI